MKGRALVSHNVGLLAESELAIHSGRGTAGSPRETHVDIASDAGSPPSALLSASGVGTPPSSSIWSR